LTERLKAAVKTVVLAGYQLDKEAFEILKLLQDREDLEGVTKEIVEEVNQLTPKPMIVTKDVVEKVTAKLRKEKELAAPTTMESVRARIPYAKQVESRIQIMRDPTKTIGSGGTIEDFNKHFRDRFNKISRILRERLDTRDTRTIGEALEAPPNERVKFIAMVMEKREKRRRIFLQVDDLENAATVLIPAEADRLLIETAQRTPLDQVVCIEATRAGGDLFIGQNIILPDIPEKRANHADEPVHVALLSDMHIGSRTFLEEAFSRFVLWLNGKIGGRGQVEIAERTKYVVIAGDLVDGIGVYPRQEDELSIKDVREQYKVVAQYIEQIPDYMDVIFIPGNHDAVRQALPQPAIPKEFAEPIYAARDVISLGNPAEIKIHNVNFLLYHGRSLDDVVATFPNLSFQTPEKAMELLLKCRHLAPEYGKRTTIAPEREDYLVIEAPPDVFQSGHIHVAKYETYRGTLVVNCGAWQAQTDYQRKLGLDPTPGILPVLNLQTLELHTIDFMSQQ